MVSSGEKRVNANTMKAKKLSFETQAVQKIGWFQKEQSNQFQNKKI